MKFTKMIFLLSRLIAQNREHVLVLKTRYRFSFVGTFLNNEQR